MRDAKVSVIKLGMGSLPPTQILDRDRDRANDEAYEAGVIFVCAGGQPLSSVVPPAHAARLSQAVSLPTQPQRYQYHPAREQPAAGW